MGAWGIGLYASDFACDLRATIKAVARLPFPPDRLVDLVAETEREAANDPKDSDHTIFWLTIADQFAKRGIDSPKARDRALTIIADGSDLATMAGLGMDERSLAKRRAKLDELRAFLLRPVEPTKPRAVLKAPQKLILDVGDALTYPTCAGDSINPYAVGKDWAWVKAWRQDGWGVCVVADRGLVFDFLAWYRPFVVCPPFAAAPTLAEITEPHPWFLRRAGTLSPRHRDAMQMKPLGRVEIDQRKVTAAFGKQKVPIFEAVADVSLADGLGVDYLLSKNFVLQEAFRIKAGGAPTPRIGALGEVTA